MSKFKLEESEVRKRTWKLEKNEKDQDIVIKFNWDSNRPKNIVIQYERTFEAWSNDHPAYSAPYKDRETFIITLPLDQASDLLNKIRNEVEG